MLWHDWGKKSFFKASVTDLPDSFSSINEGIYYILNYFSVEVDGSTHWTKQSEEMKNIFF